MKSYPYIGEAKNGSVVLFYGSETGLSLNDDAGSASFGSLIGQCLESEFFNITAEYLVNTYGEVKSKEHAEFIRKLCEVNGISVNEHPSNLDTHFVILNNILHYCYSKPSVEVKQITIPLPPECDSVDEWPKVGDEARVKHHEVKIVVSKPDSRGFIIVQTKDGEYSSVHIDDIQKPKTPEQELRDEISDLAFNQFNDDSYDLTHNSYYLAEQLISKYNITKKGEGDE